MPLAHWSTSGPCHQGNKEQWPGLEYNQLFFGMPVSDSHKSFLRQRILLICALKALKMASHESLVVGRVRQLPRADDFGGQEREIDYDLIRCYWILFLPDIGRDAERISCLKDQKSCLDLLCCAPWSGWDRDVFFCYGLRDVVSFDALEIS